MADVISKAACESRRKTVSPYFDDCGETGGDTPLRMLRSRRRKPSAEQLAVQVVIGPGAPEVLLLFDRSTARKVISLLTGALLMSMLIQTVSSGIYSLGSFTSLK